MNNVTEMYRQSPVKSPDIKNIIVVTLTYWDKLAHVQVVDCPGLAKMDAMSLR